MSRTSSNGCPDSRDLAGRLPGTDAVCSGHGILPITMRQGLHMKREKTSKYGSETEEKSCLSQGHAASSLMVLISKICVLGRVPGFIVLSQKSWRLNAAAKILDV